MCPFGERPHTLGRGTGPILDAAYEMTVGECGRHAIESDQGFPPTSAADPTHDESDDEGHHDSDDGDVEHP